MCLSFLMLNETLSDECEEKTQKLSSSEFDVFQKTTRFPPSINNSVVGRRVVRKKFKVEKKDRSSEQTLKNSASGQKKEKEEKIQKYSKASQNSCHFYL